MTKCNNQDGDYVSPICSNEADAKYRYKSGANDPTIVHLCDKCAENLREDLFPYESLEKIHNI